MTRSALSAPLQDPTPIFEIFRGSYGTELLTAAVAHFEIFSKLQHQEMTLDELAASLGLGTRPATVLVTALRAMKLLDCLEGRLRPTELASEHLIRGGEFDVGDYVGLAASAPGVLQMVQLLRENRPIDGGDGAAFIYRDGLQSAMEGSETARHFTLALAGRAKNVAPALARVIETKESSTLLDVGGGTGIYSFALLQANPSLRAIVFDRPEVLKVAEEMAVEHGVRDRVELAAGDMFADDLPDNVDAILLSNILHDWDIPECVELVSRCEQRLPSGGCLHIHDVFLNDDLDGPLEIALYSAALFTLTEGRAYSAGEYRSWMEHAGLKVGTVAPTLVHCGVLSGVKG